MHLVFEGLLCPNMNTPYVCWVVILVFAEQSTCFSLPIFWVSWALFRESDNKRKTVLSICRGTYITDENLVIFMRLMCMWQAWLVPTCSSVPWNVLSRFGTVLKIRYRWAKFYTGYCISSDIIAIFTKYQISYKTSSWMIYIYILCIHKSCQYKLN